ARRSGNVGDVRFQAGPTVTLHAARSTSAAYRAKSASVAANATDGAREHHDVSGKGAGRRPAPLPAPTDRAASAERRRDLVQAFEHQVLVVGELDGQPRAERARGAAREDAAQVGVVALVQEVEPLDRAGLRVRAPGCDRV